MSRAVALMRSGATVCVLLLLLSCNGDALNTSATGSSQAPIITTPPASTTVVIGQPATFTVSAIGSAPLAYQWQRDGSDISRATQATYTPTAAASTDNGALFDVRVSNTFGSVTSSDATLTVQ